MRSFTKSRQFLPISTKSSKPSQQLAGVTAIELLIAMGIASILFSVVLGLILSSRRLYDTDHTRVQTLQNLRSNLDVIGVDIRKAGVNLPASFPALLISDGGLGADTLTVRQGLVDTPLIICVDNTLIVYDTNQPNCNFEDNNSNSFPDLLDTWQSFRLADGGTLKAYIYDPINGQGEFFDINNESDLGGGQYGLTGTTSNSYLQGARIYIIEERKYQLVSDVLEMVVNEVNTFEVSFGITDLQFQVGLQDGSTTNSFDVTDNWKTIDWIDVNITAHGSDGEGATRTLSSRLLPRNVISGN